VWQNARCDIKEYNHVFTIFEIITVASMKIQVFWVITPYLLENSYRGLQGVCCCRLQCPSSTKTILDDLGPEEGGSQLFRNIGNYLPTGAASHSILTL
jgi:hypothetical protein